MRRLWIWIAVAAAGAALAEGDEGLVESRGDNAWHFRIGPVMAPRVRVRMRGPRTAYPSTLPTTSASSDSSESTSGTGGGSSVADPSAGFVERQYADGYVKPDEGTEDPGSFISGLTWDWGANSVPAQYSGGRMEFHTDVTRWSESVSRSVSSSSFSVGSGGPDARSDQDILLGVEAMGGWTFSDTQMFDAALDAGFRFYGSGNLKSESSAVYGYDTSTTITKTRTEYRFVDSYDASGWTDVPNGSYTGTPGGPGRIIGAMPTRREEQSSSTTSTESHETRSYYYSRSESKLNYRIWDMRLGPTLGWEAMDWLTLRGGVYGLLGVADVKLRAETGAMSDVDYAKRSCCDAIFGLAGGLSAQVNLTDRLFLVGGAEYDWWTDDVALRTGGASAHIKLSDFTVSLALGVGF